MSPGLMVKIFSGCSLIVLAEWMSPIKFSEFSTYVSIQNTKIEFYQKVIWLVYREIVDVLCRDYLDR